VNQEANRPKAALTVVPYLEKSGDDVRLLGTHCDDCGYNTFPPTTVCPQCMSLSVSPLRLDGTGKLYSYTTLRHAKAFTFGGCVDFAQGVRVFGHLAGFSDDNRPVCDMAVKIVAAEPVPGATTSAPVDFNFVAVEASR
jgi:uncharacterized OB-fold protein